MFIPHNLLEPDTLRRLIESFVLREGTDYGEEIPLAAKVAQVKSQLDAGSAVIAYDEKNQTCTIVPRGHA